MPPLELVAQTAPSTDILTILSRGGTGALIVALGIAVFVLYRRNEALHTALVDAHRKHGEDYARMTADQHKTFADIADRYNAMLATVNNARVDEMRVVTEAAHALREESTELGRSGTKRGRS